MPCQKGTMSKKSSSSPPQETEKRGCKPDTIPKTKCACIVEAHESTKNHEDHIASKGYTSMTHYNLVHKFIPMKQAMKILDAKAVVDKEWKKLETIPAWQLGRVKSKKDVILEAQRDKKKVHFGTLIDICHLKNAELEPKLQKYKGRVVLRGDIVKDELWSLYGLY